MTENDIELIKTLLILACWIIGAILFIYNLGWGAFIGLFFLLWANNMQIRDVWVKDILKIREIDNG